VGYGTVTVGVRYGDGEGTVRWRKRSKFVRNTVANEMQKNNKVLAKEMPKQTSLSINKFRANIKFGFIKYVFVWIHLKIKLKHIFLSRTFLFFFLFLLEKPNKEIRLLFSSCFSLLKNKIYDELICYFLFWI
jgi:hypothetical protein